MYVILSEIWEIVKGRSQEILLGLCVLLLSFLSFGIGYLVAKEDLREPLRIGEVPEECLLLNNH
ncbi:MAG: hypothetical protein Q8P70_02530 [bacterium]|nr:hypothetical protein [bacterium]